MSIPPLPSPTGVAGTASTSRRRPTPVCSGRPDEDHVNSALAQGRVIFTEDDDYLVLDARGVPHAGIVYCHQQSRRIGEIIQSLVSIREVHDPSEMANRVEYI
jgi:hypothetical protein